jgi:DNA-directed RNA polymerase specialized sigma24 family protein
MHVPTASSSAFLINALAPIATIARRKTASIARTVYASFGEHVNRDEFKIFSETSAFLAYLDLGGTADKPELFAWDQQQRELLRGTQHHLRKLLRATDMNDYEERNRSRCRPERASVDEFRWDAWRQAASDTSNVDRPRGSSNNAQSHDAEQERAMHEEELQELGKVLAQVLSADDLDLITQHYFEGKTQREIAAAMATGGSERELLAAENLVNKRMSRARERARKRLADHWRRVLTEECE